MRPCALRSETRCTLNYEGLIGWPTKYLLAHDTCAPGLLRRGISGSEQCRQAIFAALALEAINLGEGKDDRATSSRSQTSPLLLRDGTARTIIEASYGACPDGYLGALERIGPKPLRRPDAYTHLYRLFADPAEKHRATALKHVGSVTDGVIQIVTALRAPFTTHSIISRLRHIGDAQAFIRAVDILQQINTHATDQAILDAAKALRPDTRLNTLIDRLVKRADILPPCPIPDDDEVRGFKTAAELIGTGHRFRNCLRTKLRDVLSGYSSFCVFRDEVIMEFARLSSGGYLYIGCHGPRNGPLPADIEAATREKAAQHQLAHVVLPNAWSGFIACGRLLPDVENVLPKLAT